MAIDLAHAPRAFIEDLVCMTFLDPVLQRMLSHTASTLRISLALPIQGHFSMRFIVEDFLAVSDLHFDLKDGQGFPSFSSPPPVVGGRKRLRKTRGSSQLNVDSIQQESQDDISRVLEQNDVEEEVESQTLDASRVAQQEASMMIVPYVVRPEVPSVGPSNEENKIYMDMGEDILQKTRMFSCHHCPPIHLCRLIPYARFRGLCDDLLGLKIAFAREGYVAEKGAFIVSIWTRDKEVSIVDESIQRDWDPIWHEVNKEFEADLVLKPELQELMGHMFYVWEGNHRTMTWTSTIKECFKETKVKHCRVLCIIIDPTRVSEIALPTSLQRMNYLNTHALVTTTLRDELVSCANICFADHGEYLKDLPERDRMLIARITKKSTKGVEPWYPLTRRYLGKLVFNVQISKALNKKVEEARLKMSDEELRLFEEKENEELASRYGDRIGKILNIVDPKHGDTWRSKVWSLKWGPESFATLEKLNLLALSDVQMESNFFWLILLEANKATKSMYGLARGDHLYRQNFVCLQGKGHVPSIPVRAKQWLLTLNEETYKQKEKHVEKQRIDVESQKSFDISHHMEDLETKDYIQGNTLKGQKRLSKRTKHFIYLATHYLGYMPHVENPKSIVVVGDYITIGKDFMGGRKNDTFYSVHEFIKQNKPSGVNYTKMGKTVDWAADFIFLDLPFEGTQSGEDPCPTWDFVYEDHVRYGIGLAASTLADLGWLLVMASMVGDFTIGWIERYVCVYDLEIVRRDLVVIHHSTYGFKEICGICTDCSMSMLFMVRRRATDSPIFIAESTPLFESFGMHPLDTSPTIIFWMICVLWIRSDSGGMGD
ncbi:hypothetical protein L7F22_067476 [Adiantum nelumboides]|nr:hypothetical protein [Adiantum nelumboides]